MSDVLISMLKTDFDVLKSVSNILNVLLLNWKVYEYSLHIHWSYSKIKYICIKQD